MSTTSAPALTGAAPPPVRRDPMVLTWLAGTTISAFGDLVWTVALAWTAVQTVTPTLAGAVLGAEMFPQAVLVLLGGVLADRFDPRRILVVGHGARALVLALGALAWQAGYDGAATLFAIALSFGVVAGLTDPSGGPLLREFVRPDDFGTVMGSQQVLGRTMRLLGAPAGGVIVAWYGPAAAMVIDGATFAVIALVLALIVRARYAVPRATPTRWWDSFSDGVGYLRRSPTARIFITGLTALNVFVTPVVALGLALRVEQSGWGAHWLGFADATLAAGAIAGSLLAIRWAPSHTARAGFRILVLQGIGLTIVGIPSLPVALWGMLTVGVTAGMASVWLSGAFLKAIAPEYTGRVSSVTGLGDMTLVPLSLPLLGAVAGATSVLTSTLTWGLAMSALCLTFASRTAIATLTCFRPLRAG